jgi:CheY-like chemotaxis protein
MRKVIVVLEDNSDRVAVMKEWLAERLSMYESFFSDDPSTIVGVLTQRTDDILAVSLDHDLFDRADGSTTITGMEVAKFLSRKEPRFPILIHSSNAIDADRMQRMLVQSRWPVSRVTPFDDTNWIGTDWYPTLRRAIGKSAVPVSVSDESDIDE